MVAASPAQEIVVRTALLMMALAPDSPCTPAQKDWIARRVGHKAPLTQGERDKIRQPLLDWYAKAHPRTLPIVAVQFEGK